MKKNNDNVHTLIELDSLSSAVLNSLSAHVAIMDSEGTIVAFNNNWKIHREDFEEKWTHPELNKNILSVLQQPLAEGNDFALRLLLGIKDVLHEERESFEMKCHITSCAHRKTFAVTVKTLGENNGAILIYEDISAQIQNQTYLKETREKFEKHFQNSLYGILVADESNSVIEANNVACEILQVSQKDLVFSDITNYLNINMDVADIQKMINREGNYIGEYEIKTANGSIIPIELSVTIFRNENGKPVTSWAFKNISQKRNAEQALKATEQQYKLQFNNTLEGTIIGRPDGLIIAVNPAACDMLGYEPGELEGKYRDLVFDMNNPVNKEAIANRRENGSFTGEVEFTHKDGHKIPVEVSSVIFEAEGGEEKTIINIRDISSRKAIQQQLLDEKEFTESAISSLPTAFFVFNLKGEMIRWNNMLEQDLGYTYEEIANTSVTELVHPKDQPLLSKILDGVLLGKKISVEARCITKSGQVVHYLLQGTSFEQNGEHYIVGGGLNRNNIIEIENERQQVKKELQRTKHFNELAVDGANLGLLEVDLVTGYTYFNERWFKLLGYDYDKDSNAFTKQSFFSILHPEDKEIPESEFLRYKKEGGRYEAEFRLKSADGSYKWILAIAKFVDWDEDGEPTKLAGSHMDITERKLAEVESKRTQKLLNQLFFNSPIGIVLVDADGRVQKINQSFNHIFGYTDAEVIGKNLDETIVPKAMDQQGEKLSRLSFTGDSFQTETIRLNKNGKEIPVLVGGVPVEMDGEVIAIYGMYVDITQRKSLENQIVNLLETEQKARVQMQDMFEESPSAIAMLEGKEHIYNFVNQKYKELVGKEDLVGLSVKEALPEMDEQGFTDLLDTCYNEDKSFYFNEKKIYFNNGSNGASKSHYLNFVYKPIHNENGDVYGIFVEAIDVTEQVEARNIIEKSLAEKETLLGEVHHRVKNNLAIISGLLELEILDNQDQKISKHLHSTQSRITTIAKIHELLYRNESLTHVSFRRFIETVVKEGAEVNDNNAYKLITSFDLDEVELNVNQAIPAGMLLNEVLDYLALIKSNEGMENVSLSLKMKTTNDCVRIELEDPSATLLPSYEADHPNTNLRKELIDVLSSQIDGSVILDSDTKSTLSIHFAKRELKGPHSALKN
ncbi:MAG: PAS domain S-box protein [Gracilimonas sp.]|uniref:PAS domain S-box protein n=1 Tax=Gracilimonas TaxID=649462 RepID=UPI001B2752B6|nr:PAS domain S-box protein [Gracilimonas sp.]MBO6584570.1 PAS domain S-box protein [Gracilimonas sp.]MBO6616159.1 PAS domain S-box protein [Gracilimonas sp.]